MTAARRGLTLRAHSAARTAAPLARVCALAALLACSACASVRIPAKPLDRTVVVTLDDLRSLGYSISNEYDRFEDLARAEGMGGSVEIQYEFDPPQDAGIPLYLYALAELQASNSDALASYTRSRAGAWAGSQGLEMRSGGSWLDYGDASHSEFAYAGETPFALFFETRKDHRVFTLIVAGPVFDDLDLWRQIILRRLAALEAMH